MMHVHTVVSNGMRMLRDILREIFDESAYERYLAREGTARSTGSDRDFLKERSALLSRKARCC